MFGYKTVLPEEIAGVRILPSTRARRMNLRVDARSGDVVLTLPPRTSVKRAEKFITDSNDWIEKQRIKKAERADICDGFILSVMEETYTLRHHSGRGVSRFDGDEIIIHGKIEHLRRRLHDFLKKEIGKALVDMSFEKAERLKLSPTSVRVIDPKARWGSCAPDGRLMFSWRLGLMPFEVMDYVVAHEVAHRVHLNHSKEFWKLCDSLTTNGISARRWLRVEGDRIMRMI